MPIPLTDLDDRTFADLTAQARALIPVLHPEWTDHNPSDPGITLVELLAALTEMMIYQIGVLPPEHTRAFLSLLNGAGWTAPPDERLDLAVRETVRALRAPYRAATTADYELLVGRVWPTTPEAAAAGEGGGVRRVRCVPDRDLTLADPARRREPAPGHVSVVVLPRPAPGRTHPRPGDELVEGLRAFLEPRRLLATRHHVVGPGYAEIGVSARLALTDDAPPGPALAAAADALHRYLSPLDGGRDRQGWPFGRDLHTGELYAVLEAVALVDYVEDLALEGPSPVRAPDGEVTSVTLDQHELVRLARLDLVGYDARGRTFPLAWAASPATAAPTTAAPTAVAAP